MLYMFISSLTKFGGIWLKNKPDIKKGVYLPLLESYKKKSTKNRYRTFFFFISSISPPWERRTQAGDQPGSKVRK